MTISPAPQFPERSPNVYERKGASNATRRGPLRFEEGIATIQTFQAISKKE